RDRVREQRAPGDRTGDHFGLLHEIVRQEIDQILSEAPDRRRVAKKLMRVHIDAAVIPVPVVEVSVEHQHFGLLQIAERFVANVRVSVHQLLIHPYNTRRTSSFTYTARPPTIVAAAPPRSCQPSNGVFRDLDRIRAAETRTARSGATIVMSAGAPGASEPPATPRILAGFTDSSSTRRASDTRPACTSRSRQSDTAVSRPVIPNGARSNSTCFSS